jgi:tetratricopeptide (TPR) repeat protein
MLLVLAVGIGVFARELGSGDPTPRRAARDHAGEGITALLEGRYATARNQLNVALRKDERFAEGYMARALAWLGLGDLGRAREDAQRAVALFGEGEIDPIAWKGKDLAEARGRIIAGRIDCVARAADGRDNLAQPDYDVLVRLLYDVFRNTECHGAEVALSRYTGKRAYPVVTHAMTLCPDLWTCRKAR